jgi:hypothetical protein
MTDSCALIEGPKWADTMFYGKWLLAQPQKRMRYGMKPSMIPISGNGLIG